MAGFIPSARVYLPIPTRLAWQWINHLVSRIALVIGQSGAVCKADHRREGWPVGSRIFRATNKNNLRNESIGRRGRKMGKKNKDPSHIYIYMYIHYPGIMYTQYIRIITRRFKRAPNDAITVKSNGIRINACVIYSKVLFFFRLHK